MSKRLDDSLARLEAKEKEAAKKEAAKGKRKEKEVVKKAGGSQLKAKLRYVPNASLESLGSASSGQGLANASAMAFAAAIAKEGGGFAESGNGKSLTMQEQQQKKADTAETEQQRALERAFAGSPAMSLGGGVSPTLDDGSWASSPPPASPPLDVSMEVRRRSPRIH